ncbi:hypothetical protein Gotri_027780, partial [Gossypium trilobum]|nr:hypothetical protein [Gossypium trilobum]
MDKTMNPQGNYSMMIYSSNLFFYRGNKKRKGEKEDFKKM